MGYSTPPLKSYFVKCPHCGTKSIQLIDSPFIPFWCSECEKCCDVNMGKAEIKVKIYNGIVYLFTCFVLFLPIVLMVAIEIAFGILFIITLPIVAFSITLCYLLLGEKGRKLWCEACYTLITNTRRRFCYILGVPLKKSDEGQK